MKANEGNSMREEERNARQLHGYKGKGVGDDGPPDMNRVNSSTCSGGKDTRQWSVKSTSETRFHSLSIYLSAMIFFLISSYFYAHL